MYIGNFRDINDIKYSVEIQNEDTAVTELVLGTPPFTVSIEGDENTIYKPTKYSSATISIVSNNYLFDLYSANAHKNKVVLKKGNKILWVGYITPNLYSQPYNNELESFEVECIDALSTLQYYDYETIDGTTKQIADFTAIINKLLSKCDAYTRFYISTSIKYDQTDVNSFAHYAKISESNFFDSDDNEPLNCKDVLEQICTFMNMTCIAIGDEVYFVNYDEIKHGKQKYNMYTINGDLMNTTVETRYFPITVQHNLYNGSSHTLSLEPVYNKVSVVSEHNTIDSLLPDITDDKLIFPYLPDGVIAPPAPFEDIKINKKWYRAEWEWYQHKYYQEFWYDKQGNAIQKPNRLNPAHKPLPYFDVTDVVNNISGTVLQHSAKNSDKEVEHNPQYAEPEVKKSLTPYLLLSPHCYIEKLIPLYKITYNKLVNLVVSGDTRLVLNGNVRLYTITNYTDKPVRHDEETPGDAMKNCSKNLYLPVYIKLNGKYYNTEATPNPDQPGNEWQSTPCLSKIPLYNPDMANHDSMKHIFGKDLTIRNNISYLDGYGDTGGFSIQLPQGITPIGDLEITFMNWDKSMNAWLPYPINYAFIDNFTAEFVRYKKVDLSENYFYPFYNEENAELNNETDTVYENVIDDTFVEEMDEIPFKICTDDGKANAISSAIVDRGKGKGTEYLGKTYDSSTNQTYNQEEHLVWKLANQYRQPAVRINSTLKNEISVLATVTDVALPNKTFIVDSQNINYEYDSSEINLVEKI